MQTGAAADQQLVTVRRSCLEYPAAHLQAPPQRSQQRWTRYRANGQQQSHPLQRQHAHCGSSVCVDRGRVSCVSVSLGILRIYAAAALPVQLLDWDSFDIFRVAQLSRQRPLQTVTWALLHHFNVVGDLSLPPDKLRGFLRVRRHGDDKTVMHATAYARRSPDVVHLTPSKTRLSSTQSAHMLLQALEGGYNMNPYHNATHAADVTQNVGVMLAADDLPSKLSKLEVLAMLLAAAVHDVNHPGEHECYIPWNCSKCPELATLTSYLMQHMSGAIPLVAAACRLWV